jgi:mitogen-activated protein kinase kinase
MTRPSPGSAHSVSAGPGPRNDSLDESPTSSGAGPSALQRRQGVTMKLSNVFGGFSETENNVLGNHFQSWSQIVYVFTPHFIDGRDAQNSQLRFTGKAVLHSRGVDFFSGQSFSLRLSDLLLQEELGIGNYGTVVRVIHKITKTNMAMKQIQLQLDHKTFNAITTELQVQILRFNA